VAVLAAVLTATDLVVLVRYDIDAVWAWLQVPVMILAWASSPNWLREGKRGFPIFAANRTFA